MRDKNLWSRRKFSKAALSLQALIAAGAFVVPAGCTNGDKTKDGNILNPSRERLLQLAMDEIIPKSDKMPAASEVGGIDYILSVLEEYPELADGFLQVLDGLQEQSTITANEGFENIDRSSRVEVLQAFEKVRADQFSVLLNFVYEGYYINEKIWKLIGYEPHPTLSAGPEMEPFDETLLDRVKQMSSFYLNV